MMTQRITLQKGDYVATADIKDDAEYHAVAKAFMEAGAGKGEYPDLEEFRALKCFGWNNFGRLYHCEVTDTPAFVGGRQLTPAQILATPQWLPEVGKECMWRDNERDARRVLVMGFYGDSVWLRIIDGQTPITVHCNAASFSPLPTEEDRAVDEMFKDVEECIDPEHDFRMLYRKGYRKQPRPAEDSSVKCPEEEMAIEHWVDFAARVVKAETGSLYIEAAPKDVANILYKAMRSGRMPRP